MGVESRNVFVFWRSAGSGTGADAHVFIGLGLEKCVLLMCRYVVAFAVL